MSEPKPPNHIHHGRNLNKDGMVTDLMGCWHPPHPSHYTWCPTEPKLDPVHFVETPFTRDKCSTCAYLQRRAANA